MEVSRAAVFSFLLHQKRGTDVLTVNINSNMTFLRQKLQPAAKAAVFAWRVYRVFAKKSLALYRNKCYNALANFVEASE